jgi:asparagine synthase (glutamine-hydrolysing)
VGVFLSAGLDSTAVAAAAARGGSRLRTVTLAFDEFRGTARDEAPLAERTARVLGAEHRTVRLSREDFSGAIPQVLAAMDQPTIDGVNTYFVSRAAREAGLKVALSGLGGDELLGGYPSFDDVPRWTRLFAVSHVPLVRTMLRAAAEACVGGGRPKAPALFEYGGTYAGAYLVRRGLFMPWEVRRLLRADTAEEGLRRLGLPGREPNVNGAGAFAKVALLEASSYLRNQLLRDADWAGMAHSLEIRVPFVDATLARRVGPSLAALPGRRHKEVLTTGLPEALRDLAGRPKSGFGVPMESWLGADARFDSWRRVPALRGQACHWSRRWAYAVLEAWTGSEVGKL